MKNLYFVRHGESELNQNKKWSGQTNTPLTSKGHEQAKHAGQQANVMRLRFDLIISSPLSRALDTAKYIAAAIDYPSENITVDDRFAERSFGSLETQPHTFRIDSLYAINESSVDKYGGESFTELQKRALQAAEYLRSLDQETVLVVAHSAFGRALFRALLPDRKRLFQFKNAEIVKII